MKTYTILATVKTQVTLGDGETIEDLKKGLSVDIYIDKGRGDGKQDIGADTWEITQTLEH